MPTKTAPGVTTKIFIGCQVTPDISIALRNSAAWHEDKNFGGNDKLQIINHNGKEYLGTFLASNKIILPEFKTQEQEVLKKIEQYCPELSVSGIVLKIFPQLFIS